MSIPESDLSRLDTTILDRVLAGEGSAEDVRAVQAWMADDETRQMVRDVLAGVEVGGVGTAEAAPVGEAWRRWQTRWIEQEEIGSEESGLRQQSPSAQRSSPRPALGRNTVRPVARRPLGWWMGSFLTVAIVAMGLGLVQLIHPRHLSERVAAEYVTRTGERMTFTLTDGTRVTLAPRTRLRLMPSFGEDRRTVSLDGEAYFEVTHATGTPFVVQAGPVSARVLGTAFTVRHYGAGSAAQIAVMQGKIAISGRNVHRLPVTLLAGQIASVTDSTIQARSVDDVGTYGMWTHGYLVLRDAPTTDVLATLTRWYGYQFILADSALVHRHLNIWLSTQSLPEALATVKLALNADLAFQDSTVTVHSRRTKARTNERRQDVLSPSAAEAGR